MSKKSTIIVAALALTVSAAAFAGDALTQSLEQKTDRGTVGALQPGGPSPTPPPLKRTMTDKEAKKRVHIHRKGQRPPPPPLLSPTPLP